MTTITHTAETLRAALARRNFMDFLVFVQVQNTDVADKEAATPFEMWAHLVRQVKILVLHRLLIILKARQVGVSWLLAAYALWTALYHPGANVLLLSQGKFEAAKLLGKVKFIHERLPASLQGDVVTSSTTEFKFASASTITALPATENAGRSETATLVIQDEADYHENLESNFAAIRPTVDAGGQHIMVSTSDHETIDSFFKQSYRRASRLSEDLSSLEDGETRYVKEFLSWDVRPGRTEEWHQAVINDYLDREHGIKEYPSTEQEALKPPSTLLAFDEVALEDMQQDVREPMRIEGMPMSIRIWRKFAPGKKYAAFTDSSHGVGKDSGVTVVMDCETGAIVADIFRRDLDPEVLATESVKMLDAYGSPVWGIEDNDWGVVVIRAARRMKYRRIFQRRDKYDRPVADGWHTDESSRYILYGDLQVAIKDRHLTLFAEDGLRELGDVIKNPDKHGRIEAIKGGHDDYALAVGGVWQMRKYARRSRAGTPLPLENNPLFRVTPDRVRIRSRW